QAEDGIRDFHVTGVQTCALPIFIVASIMSKKLAAGLGALVLDVKTGSGAFMRDEGRARALARALVRTGNSCGVKTEALLTDMSRSEERRVGEGWRWCGWSWV